jgi:DNA-binding transcriptional ArsR family regulator
MPSRGSEKPIAVLKMVLDEERAAILDALRAGTGYSRQSFCNHLLDELLDRAAVDVLGVAPSDPSKSVIHIRIFAGDD